MYVLRRLVNSIKMTRSLTTVKIGPEKMKNVLTKNITDISKLFEKRGYEVRIVGGAVRDLIMEKECTDLDLATTATPDQMKQMFTEEEVRMLNPRGEKHGTITARYNEENFEFTTLKIDSKKDGSSGEIQFITDWGLDAERRDLTINSLFLGLDGTVYDYFNGMNDIKDRKITFVTSADDRIREDYLRILRYFRFYGRIAENEDNHNQSDIDSICNNVKGLEQVSGERIWSELTKIITGKFGNHLLIKILDCGIGPYIGFPKNFNKENFMNKYSEHCSENCLDENIHYITVLTAGFESSRDCENFINRVKCSNKDKELMYFIIDHRDLVLNSSDFKIVQDLVIDTILIKRKEEKLTMFYIQELLKYLNKLEFLELLNAWSIPPFPIKGHTLRKVATKPKFISKIHQELIQIWKQSDYCLGGFDLLEALRDHDLCNSEALENVLNSAQLDR